MCRKVAPMSIIIVWKHHKDRYSHRFIWIQYTWVVKWRLWEYEICSFNSLTHPNKHIKTIIRKIIFCVINRSWRYLAPITQVARLFWSPQSTYWIFEFQLLHSYLTWKQTGYFYQFKLDFFPSFWAWVNFLMDIYSLFTI